MKMGQSGHAALVACLALATAPLFAEGPVCTVVPGWTQAGPARSYLADTLYDYMDGNSEGYLITAFSRCEA
jgi:hypothetical protein